MFYRGLDSYHGIREKWIRRAFLFVGPLNKVLYLQIEAELQQSNMAYGFCCSSADVYAGANALTFTTLAATLVGVADSFIY